MTRRERLEASRTAVYRHVSDVGAVLYVGCSANPFARYGTHLCTSTWAYDVANIEVEWFPDRESALRVESDLIDLLQPPFNSRPENRPKRNWPSNIGHEFFADWLKWTGLRPMDVSVATGLNRQAVKKMASKVSHPRGKTAARIEIFTSGYVPSSVWNGYGGPKDFCRVSAESAAETLSRARQYRPWAKHFPTFQGPFPDGFFPSHQSKPPSQEHGHEDTQTP